MNSSFAGLGAAQGGARAVFMASACATMLIATGLVFRKRKRRSCLPMQSLYGTAAAAADALDRVAGMIKKAVYRSLGRRVRGEDDKIPPIKTVAPDLPLAVLRRMDIRVDPRSAPTCAPPNALRIRPAHASTSSAHVSPGRRSELRGAGPVPPPPDRHARSHMQHRLLHLRVRRARGRRPQRPPGTRTSGTSRCSV